MAKKAETKTPEVSPLPVDETSIAWTSSEIAITAYALGIPSGNAEQLLKELNQDEREAVSEACKAEQQEALRLVRDIVSNHQQRKAKPKVDIADLVDEAKEGQA